MLAVYSEPFEMQDVTPAVSGMDLQFDLNCASYRTSHIANGQCTMKLIDYVFLGVDRLQLTF